MSAPKTVEDISLSVEDISFYEDDISFCSKDMSREIMLRGKIYLGDISFSKIYVKRYIFFGKLHGKIYLSRDISPDSTKKSQNCRFSEFIPEKIVKRYIFWQKRCIFPQNDISRDISFRQKDISSS